MPNITATSSLTSRGASSGSPGPAEGSRPVARFGAVLYGRRLDSPVATVLGGRSTVGHRALDAVIGVRIPASQPASDHPSGELRLGRLLSASPVRTDRHAEAVSTKLATDRASEVGPPDVPTRTNYGPPRRTTCRFSNVSARSRSKHLRTRWADSRFPARIRMAPSVLQPSACMASKNASSTSFEATLTRYDTTSGSQMICARDSNGTTTVLAGTPRIIDHGRSLSHWNSQLRRTPSGSRST